MDESNMGAELVCPWKRRESLPVAPFYVTVINFLLTVVISAVAPIGSILTLFLFASAAAVPFAVCLLSSGSPFVFASVPLSFVLSLIICGDVGGALLSLLYVPLALVPSAMLYGNFGRHDAFVAYTGVSALMRAIVFTVALILTYGTLRGGIDVCIADLESSISATLGSMKESGMYENIIFPEGFEAELARASVSLLPGILIMISEIGAGIVLALIWKYLAILKIAPAFRTDGWRFEVSRPVGFIFAGAYTLSALLSFVGSAEMLGYAATNLTMICLIPIFVVGIRSFRERSKARPGNFRFIIIAALIASLLFMPVLLIIALAVVCLRGTLAVIMAKPAGNENGGGGDGKGRGGHDGGDGDDGGFGY